jgi:hypothetical protein
MTREALLAAFEPLVAAAVSTDLSAPDAAERVAAALSADAHEALVDGLRAAHAEGWLTPKRSPEGIGFGRLLKPAESAHGASIDVVDMRDVAGAPHTHPNGEVSLCVPLTRAPTFEGRAEGIVVMPPGSRHVPETRGGRMLIAYLLPGGAMTWG